MFRACPCKAPPSAWAVAWAVTVWPSGKVVVKVASPVWVPVKPSERRDVSMDVLSMETTEAVSEDWTEAT